MSNLYIIEADTLEDIQRDVLTIDTFAIQYHKQLGYTITQDETTPTGFAVVSRKNGKDDPFSVTKTWAYPKQSPEGTWYIYSLTNQDQFKNWKQVFSSAGLSLVGQEKIIPESWELISDD